MSSTVSGMATAAGRWSTARFHARRASSQWLSLGVTNSPVSCSRSVSTDLEVDVEMASLLITFMGAKVWAANHSSVGLPDESGSSARTTPISGSGALRAALPGGGLARAAGGLARSTSCTRRGGLAPCRLPCGRLPRRGLACPLCRALLRRRTALRRSPRARPRALLRGAATRAGAADVQPLFDCVSGRAQIADHAPADLLCVTARVTAAALQVGEGASHAFAYAR